MLAASVKAIQLETERKIVAMTWQDDRNDEDPDTQTVYKIKSSSATILDNQRCNLLAVVLPVTSGR